MSHAGHVIYALARADFLERVRRYSFLMTLALALYFGYLAIIGKIVLSVNNMRGVANSAWVGGLLALVGSTFLSLAGFYFVKNTVERDRETRVGQILASTPISKLQYVFGKLLSNFAILSAMIAVLALSAFVMQLYTGEERHIHLWPLLSPFLLIALPSMAVVASLALLFETIRFLRGGLGNVAYFFVWVTALSLPIATQRTTFDWAGIAAFENSMRAVAPNPQGLNNFQFSLNIGPDAAPSTLFRWEGIAWSREAVLARLMWFAIALAITAVAAAFFDRFDTASAHPGGTIRKATVQPAGGIPLESGATSEELASNAVAVPSSTEPAGVGHATLMPLSTGSVHSRFAALLLAEVRLMVKGRKWWFYFVAASLWIAGLVVPDAGARGIMLALAWIWPVLIWSQMGVRESRDGMAPVLFSAPHPLTRQLPAAWLGGVLVALAAGSGFALRLLVGLDFRGVFAWAVGALFIPTAALALGVWSASSKPFEILFTLLWYVGPMHRTPMLDFMGSAPATVRTHYPLIYLVMTCMFAVAAVLGRKRQLLG